MPNNILIVESDSALSHSIRTELEARGFSVEETSDGKGSVELIRRQKPDLVVMAVDLSAGQNGYLLCGKLKKDDELKRIPIVIIGNPKGFEAHRKLPKAHADDYVAKPLDVGVLVDSIGGLIGFPEVPAATEDDGLSLADLMDAEPAEEIEVDTESESTYAGDPALDMLDAAFEDATTDDEPTTVGQLPAADDAFSALDALDDVGGLPPPLPDELPIEEVVEDFADDSEDRTMVGFLPDPPTGEYETPDLSSPPSPYTSSLTSEVDAGELRTLRTRVAELESALEDSQGRANDHESRVRDLEDALASREAELEAARASSGDGNKEQVFALRAESNKKDKDILRLRSEINEKDLEINELKDKSLQLEQQLSESSGEMARRDAQIKTLQTRADQLSSERKRFDQQLLHAKEEARTANASLTTVQTELDELRARYDHAHRELESLRHRHGDLESELRQVRDERDELRREITDLRDNAESVRRELDEVRSQLEQASIDVDAAKNQLSAQATAFGEEAGGMRRRITELEESAHKHEERLTRFYGKIKEDEKIREKTRKALAIALQLLDEQQHNQVDLDDVEVDVDDAAEA